MPKAQLAPEVSEPTRAMGCGCRRLSANERAAASSYSNTSASSKLAHASPAGPWRHRFESQSQVQ